MQPPYILMAVLLAHSKTCVKRPLSKRKKIGFKTNYHLMQVKSITECSAMLLNYIKLPFVIKTLCFVYFELPFLHRFYCIRIPADVFLQFWHIYYYATPYIYNWWFLLAYNVYHVGAQGECTGTV